MTAALALVALLPWLGAALLLALPRAAPRAAPIVAGATVLVTLGCALALAPAVFAGDVVRVGVDWLPQLGLRAGARLDGLAFLFVALVAAIGALIVVYAAWYLEGDTARGRFFVYLLAFTGAMLGVVVADNLVLLVFCWELTSLTSFLLIGFWHRQRDARAGARTALAVTAFGGLCLLGGVLLVGHIVGSFDLDAVLAAGPVLRAHPMYMTALVLVLLGAFTKSAQFPFHFWLPQAMAAPTPVSAFLHSATMVKCGVFLLARLTPALGGSAEWFWIVTLTGAATLLVGAWIAIYQHDLKGLLAYSTISHLGLIVLLLGLGEPLALVAAVFHVINHATFKAGLFMSAGIIDHECGTRDMRRINGLMRVMPVTALLGIVAAASMAGVPLLNGFLSKEMFFAEVVQTQAPGAMEWLLPAAATLSGVFAVAYSLRFIHDTFFNGEPHDLPKTPHEPPFVVRLPVAVLVLLVVALGLAPERLVAPVLTVAAQAAVFGAPGPALPPYELALWHGFNLPLAMSAVAIGGGALLYAFLQRFIDLHRLARLPGWFRAGGRELFVGLYRFGIGSAKSATRALANGSLQRYLSLLVVATLAAAAWPFVDGAALRMPAPADATWSGVGAVVVAAVGIAAAIATVVARRRRVVAVILVGAVGLAVCIAFAWFGAPDLALTQLLVEVATTLLLIAALRALPDDAPPRDAGDTLPRRAAHALLAVVAGLAAAAAVWAVLGLPSASISEYFLRTTVPLGGGANAVNVILVDYRALDTLGEVTVLVVAALTIHALLAPAVAAANVPAAAADASRRGAPPLMLQIAARALLPFAVLVALHLFLRGHSLPGGGFIAGLVLALALALQQTVRGDAALGALPSATDPRRLLGAGLLVCVATGVASWWLGSPFLTSAHGYPELPVVGAVPLASAAVFDAGVWAAVVGATLVMLLALARNAPTATSPAAAR